MPGQGSQQSASAGLDTDPTDSCQRWAIGPLLGHAGTYVKDGPYLLELPLISKIRHAMLGMPLMSQIGHVRTATYNGILVINMGQTYNVHW